MNDLLFYALLAVLLYYFFIYLPQQKKNLPQSIKLTHSQTTQTAPASTENPELESTLDILIKEIQQLNKSLK